MSKTRQDLVKELNEATTAWIEADKAFDYKAREEADKAWDEAAVALYEYDYEYDYGYDREQG